MIYSSKVFAFAFIPKLNIFDMSIYINIYLEIRILKSYLVWPNRMAISMIMNLCSYNRWFQYPPFGFLAFILLYLPTTIELISG
jgi:hypothetical protein